MDVESIVIIALLLIFFIVYCVKVHNISEHFKRHRKEMLSIREEVVKMKYALAKMEKEVNALQKMQSSFPNSALLQEKPVTVSLVTNANNIVVTQTGKKCNPAKRDSSIQKLYLGSSNQGYFFEAKERKSDTSRFVAYVDPDGSTAEYELIDIERIRSTDTNSSVKQEGLVSLKEAKAFLTISMGKITKVKDESGNSCWKIDSPVVVEYKK